jgi:mycothiol synthase
MSLTIRARVSGVDDEAFLALYNRMAAEFPENPVLTRDDLERMRSQPGYESGGRFVAELNGRFVGFTSSHREADKAWLWVHVLPEFRRQGIGSALLRGQVGYWRGRGAKQAVVEISADRVAGDAFARASGFRLVRAEVVMRRTLDALPSDASVNPGVTVTRLGTDDADLEFEVELYNAVFAGTPDGEAITLEERRQWEAGRRQAGWLFDTLVARLDGIPVGMACARIDPKENTRLGRNLGFLLNLGVLARYRGQGIGQALLLCAMQVLKEHGMTEAELEVDDDNPTPAIRLYEKLGFVEKSRIGRFELELKQ